MLGVGIVGKPSMGAGVIPTVVVDPLILDQVHAGTASAPCITWAADPHLGLFRSQAGVLEIASPYAAFATRDKVQLGAGSGSTNGTDSFAVMHALLQSPNPKPGIFATVGLYGAPVSPRDITGAPGAPAVGSLTNLRAEVTYNAGQAVLATYAGADFRMNAADGAGGMVFGLNSRVDASGQFGATPFALAPTASAGVTAGQFVAKSEEGMLNHTAPSGDPAYNQPLSHVVTGLLVSAQGRNARDVIQGMEVVVGTQNGGLAAPTQRLVMALSTLDGARSVRGTGIDCVILMGKKAESPADQTFVQPWLSGILLGDNYGDREAWPFKEDSAVIRADPNIAKDLPVDPPYLNATGYVIHMGNTRVHQSYIQGGTGQTNKIFDFENVRVLNHILKVGGGTDLLGGGSTPIPIAVMIGSNGFIGVGDQPLGPFHIRNDAEFSFMRLRGSNFISAPPSPTAYYLQATAPAAPQYVARWAGIQWWDYGTNAWIPGRIPIY